MRMILKGDQGYSKEINDQAEEGLKELNRNQSSQAVFPGLGSPACPRLALSQTLMFRLSWTAQQDEADSYSELKFYQSHIEQDPKKASPKLKIPLAMPT